MGKEARERIEARLGEAGSRGSCFAATEAADLIYLRRLIKKERPRSVFEPYPKLFVKADTWQALDRGARALFIIKGIAELHPHWVFFGPSAALIHGMPVSWKDLRKPYVVTSSSISDAEKAQLVHRSSVKDELCLCQGVRVTSPVRTLFDCASRLSFQSALAIADGYARTGGLGAEELCDDIRMRFRGQRGVKRVEAICAHADGRAESGGESIARAVMIQQGFYLPELQTPLPDPIDPAKMFRADFAWESKKGIVLGELDGAKKYTMSGDPLDALRDERIRESRLTAYGHAILRFSYAQLLPRNRTEFVALLEKFGVPRGPKPRFVDGVPVKKTVNYAGWRGMPLLCAFNGLGRHGSNEIEFGYAAARRIAA